MVISLLKVGVYRCERLLACNKSVLLYNTLATEVVDSLFISLRKYKGFYTEFQN